MEGFGTIIAILALLCLTQDCIAVRVWNDFRVRFSRDQPTGFYQIPTRVNTSLTREHVKVQPGPDFLLPLDFYCHPNDPRVCFMYDRNGEIGGIQISVLKADVANVDPKEFNYTAVVNFQETKFFGVPAYSFRVYFTNPEKLTKTGRKNVSEVAEGVWIYLEGKLFQIPRHQPNKSRFDDFYKQGCLNSMGVHYTYKINPHLTDCRKNFPFFVLYDGGYLVGFGIFTPGKGSVGPQRDWYEHLTGISPVVTPYKAPCVGELAGKYGMTALHVYLVKNPWNISCS